MHRREVLREKAVRALKKKAAIGPDVDLNQFETPAVPQESIGEVNLCTLPKEEQGRLVMSGLAPTEQERDGTYFQKDALVLRCGSRQEGIEIIPIRKTLEQHDWIWDYYWKLLDVGTDKYTAAAELGLHGGYVIRALPGSQTVYPVQACFYLATEGIQQNVHNIIIAEEGSELHLITGCTTAPHLKRGLHVGVTEFYVKEGAKLTFTMIHNWAEDMVVRPRSVARVEKGGLFLSNYISMQPVRSLQMYPTTYLVGEEAVSRFYNIIVGRPNSVYDVGSRIVLEKPGTRAEIVSRTISNGGKIYARGHLIGKVPGIRAHLECRGLILNGGIIHAIPELEGQVDGVEMSHEAAVGKIAQEEMAYLMARGLSEEEATSTIVRGFLNVDIPGLPAPLRAEIDRAIKTSNKDVM